MVSLPDTRPKRCSGESCTASSRADYPLKFAVIFDEVQVSSRNLTSKHQVRMDGQGCQPQANSNPNLRQERGRCHSTSVGLNQLPSFPLREPQLIKALQVQTELRGCPEEMPQPQSCVAGN